MNQCHVLIPSGGSGQRLGRSIPKQYLPLNGQSMLSYSLDVFLGIKQINSVWVGISPDLSKDILSNLSWPDDKRISVTKSAGSTRHETVLNTLKFMLDSGISEKDWVLVHDAARPGITENLVNSLIDAVISNSSAYPGGLLALPVADTLKKSVLYDSLHQSIGGGSRDGVWLAQTPQMFKVGELLNALTSALNAEAIVTDEASAFERLGLNPLLVQGSHQNLKITFPEDWVLMEKILKQSHKLNLPKVGQGYDVHELVQGRDLILGGIKIPFDKGLLGHSDADALLHSIIDALLGSIGEGDIGRHFPDTDKRFKGVNSVELLKLTHSLVKQAGFRIGNIDATIICQKPKLAEYIPKMNELIATVLDIDVNQVNIKAKTNEGLGYLGNSEAIATESVVLVFPNF